MTDVTYAILAQQTLVENGKHITYGIAAYANRDCSALNPTAIVSVADITADRHAIADLVKRCNRLRLSTIHLFDVVEDFLAQ